MKNLISKKSLTFAGCVLALSIPGLSYANPTLCNSQGVPYGLNEIKLAETILSNLTPPVPNLAWCFQNDELQIEVDNFNYHSSPSDATPHITFRVGTCETKKVAYRTLHIYQNNTWRGFATGRNEPCTN